MTAAPGLSSAPPIAGIFARAREQGRDALSEPEAKSVLEAFGIATPRRAVIRDTDPDPHLGDLRPPYVVKVVSPTILHKSDVGGVTVGLPDAAAVISAIATMRNRITAAGHIAEAWLVEEMAPRGVEVVVGGLRDARFGPVLMCGLGGVLVELLHDVAFAICPVDRIDCEDMLQSLHGAALLRGFRGTEPASEPALIDVLLRVGGTNGLLAELGEAIAELDINPLIVSPSGAVAADARILLRAS